MFKKLIIIVAFVLASGFLLKNNVYAENIEDVSQYFTIETSVGTQSPWNNAVPIHLTFKPRIDADKVEIVWDAPAGVEITPKHPNFISTVKGNVYDVTANLKPVISGSYNVGINVIAWQYNTNYTSSSSVSIRFGPELITEPQTAGYSGAVVLKNVVIVLIALGCLFGLVFGSKYAINGLKEWLKPPE